MSWVCFLFIFETLFNYFCKITFLNQLTKFPLRPLKSIDIFIESYSNYSLNESGYCSPCCRFLATNSTAPLLLELYFWSLWSKLKFCHMDITYLSSLFLVILYFCFYWGNRLPGCMSLMLPLGKQTGLAQLTAHEAVYRHLVQDLHHLYN